MHNLSESATTNNKQSERMRAMLAAKQYIKGKIVGICPPK
jgi:hypothetical protein